jgi:hypothetical protein
MSGTHTNVPSVLAYDLPRPVPVAELEACSVGDVFRRLGDRWSMLVLIPVSALADWAVAHAHELGR